ncbi:MAG: hypothetical protein ACQCXQ_13650 [Verrucomicrobiales bacterium]
MLDELMNAFGKPGMRMAGIGRAGAVVFGLTVMSGGAQVSPQLMPRETDSTSMWWAEGFPRFLPEAPWIRCIQTGTYAFVLDTEKLTVPHFGPLEDGGDWQALEPAELAVSVTVGGKTHRCVEGAEWGRFSGPRLVTSGRFQQRADVTGLVLVAGDGGKLDAEARFETVAWPDRLALVLAVRPKSENWPDATMAVSLTSAMGALSLSKQWQVPDGETWGKGEWKQVALTMNPANFEAGETASPLVVSAVDPAKGSRWSVRYDPDMMCHRIDISGATPIAPPGGKLPSNDAMERIKLVLENPTSGEQVARLMLEKDRGGFKGRLGSAITGVSACLRDSDGFPTGIPVQISKNWHNRPEGGVYSGSWFKGISQLRLPANSKTELEFVVTNGHWGGVGAASHA